MNRNSTPVCGSRVKINTNGLHAAVVVLRPQPPHQLIDGVITPGIRPLGRRLQEKGKVTDSIKAGRKVTLVKEENANLSVA